MFAAQRDLPRRLAQVLFPIVDVIYGLSLLGDHGPRSAGLSKVPGPLDWWGAAFIVVGALIPLGMLGIRYARPTALLAIGLWGAWCSLIFLAVPLPTVTIHAPASSLGYVILHPLLYPYRRRPRDAAE